MARVWNHWTNRGNNEMSSNDASPLRSRRVFGLPDIHDSDSDESEEDEGGQESQDSDEDPLPEREIGEVSVKEAIRGLFTTATAHHITSHELIVVKKYSHGKNFRKRLAYIVFTNHSTSLIIRSVALLLNIISCTLYIIEAIYIDILQNDNEILECDHDMWNQSDASWYGAVIGTQLISCIHRLKLFLVPKPYYLWSLQLVLALFELSGACVTLYLRQEVYVRELSALVVVMTISFTMKGSIFKNFLKVIDFSLVLTFILGIWFVITLLYPQCLHQMHIPTFLYCWQARTHFMFIVLHQHSKHNFRHNYGLYVIFLGLLTILLCFFFSCICFIHHFDRIGDRINLFESYWLTVITFTTVGYGDVVPIHWSGKVIITLFLLVGILYIPPQVDKLWFTFRQHRKHHSTYRKIYSTKHVLFITVSLKPSVLRDFLSEFYSNPDHGETQCVIMVENNLPDTIKQLLYDPYWNQRVTFLLGSALRQPDLARAKARKTDACFIHTSKVSETPDEADKHTILSAWTVKAYAPHCKLYVHVIKPESKLHLDIAHEVVCENELKYSLLALNSMCPGIVTMATLLVHTFAYEERGFDNENYKSYEKCSPTEIYHIKLGDSQYFHHFEGRNFLFTAVVAYRKFHVVLMGVRRSGVGDIIFNPGINHVMKSDDICYYISETREEYSDFRVVKPTLFQEGLWKSSAMLGLLALNIADIRPEQLLEHPEDTVTHQENTDGGSLMEEEEELDNQIAAEMSNWQHDVQRGIQLLRYHGESGDHVNPSIKLSVHSKIHSDLQHTPMDSATKVPVNTIEEEDSKQGLFEMYHQSAVHPHEAEDRRKRLSHFLKPNHGNHGENTSQVSIQSSVKTNISQQSHLSLHMDPTVVLELDDVSEVEELEDLEEGRRHAIDLEENLSPVTSPCHQLKIDHSILRTYKQGPVSVLPYCGCEPLKCHLLLEPSPIEDMRLTDQGCISEDIIKQWYQKPILVYSDRVTPNLYHFIAPLRAAYIPVYALHPIILILGSQPERKFLLMIAELPMIYYTLGSLDNTDDLLRAGVLLADSLVVFSSHTKQNEGVHEHLADADNATAVHHITRLFPHLRITTDVRYRYNIRFLYNTPNDQIALQKLKHLARKSDHFSYLFLPQFVSGKAFSGSLLDTLLYQSYYKPHIIQLFRQLLGCIQVEESGFLWKIHVTEELLKLRTYARVFQRLVASLEYIPIAVFRTSQVDRRDGNGQETLALNKIESFLRGQLNLLGLQHNDVTVSKPDHQEFLLANPPPDLILEIGDIILVIRPCNDHKVSSSVFSPLNIKRDHLVEGDEASTPRSRRLDSVNSSQSTDNKPGPLSPLTVLVETYNFEVN